MSYIAILGATSQIASDLVLEWSARADFRIDLFARRPQVLTAWLAAHGLSDRFRALSFDDFGQDGIRYDAIINFVGVGDPGRAASMGASILEITRHYDEMALAYQERFPETRYLFLSSGAVYGSRFPEPVRADTPSCININDFPAQEFYAVAKLYTEVTHRARPDLPIIDIRVFNIFSRTQDLSARFLITDITRSLIEGSELVINPDPMTRDFLHPSDFTRLVDSLLSGPRTNTAVDCYSRGAVSKGDLLAALEQRFGLKWRAGPASVINATGAKPHYYSLNHKAAEFGYEPRYSSVEGLELEISAILGR